MWGGCGGSGNVAVAGTEMVAMAVGGTGMVVATTVVGMGMTASVAVAMASRGTKGNTSRGPVMASRGTRTRGGTS